MGDRKGISLHIGIDRLDPSCYPLEPMHPDFEGGWDGPLQGCEKDANAMCAIAESQGFEATKLLTADATAESVEAAIRNAASRLESGDIFMLTYAGHGGQVLDRSGDEDDDEDETWCLYDRHFLDDELYSLYGEFAEGVRILVFSDSCHSGTVTRGGPEETDEPVRAMPRGVVYNIWKARAPLYNDIQDRVAAEGNKDIKASILLLAACQDNQLATGGSENGAFTGALLKAWSDGQFEGSYQQFYDAIAAGLKARFESKSETRGGVDEDDSDAQVPNMSIVGNTQSSFDEERPFSI